MLSSEDTTKMLNATMPDKIRISGSKLIHLSVTDPDVNSSIGGW